MPIGANKVANVKKGPGKGARFPQSQVPIKMANAKGVEGHLNLNCQWALIDSHIEGRTTPCWTLGFHCIVCQYILILDLRYLAINGLASCAVRDTFRL